MFVDFDFNGHTDKVPIHLIQKLSLFEWKTIKTADSGVYIFGSMNGQWYTIKTVKKILMEQESQRRKIMSHVNVTYDKFACWEWDGCCSTSGYPMSRVDGRTIYIRNIFFDAIGVFGAEDKIKSTCHNKKCMRPGHFKLKVPKTKPKLRLLSQPHFGTRL